MEDECVVYGLHISQLEQMDPVERMLWLAVCDMYSRQVQHEQILLMAYQERLRQEWYEEEE